VRDAPTSTDSTSKRVSGGTSVAPPPRHANRSRRVVPAAMAIAVIAAALVLPPGLPPAGAEAPTTAAPTASTLDPALVAQLDAALDEGFAASGMPGVTVGLWIPGQGEWVATRGVSNLQTDEPMDRANQGKIGSITKSFVGTTALQIIGEGQIGLTLDDTIDRWYPDFPEASNITVSMLMNMSSGIGTHNSQETLDRFCADPYSTITPDEIIAIGAATPRAPFAPGGGYEYSNFNTVLLGRILEKTTGTDLTTLLNERLLGPLGMTRSRFAPDGQLSAPLTHGYTDFCPDRSPLTDTTDWYTYDSWAAGSMVSTLDDLHTWGLALGTGFGLSPAMLTARVDDTTVIQGNNEYGLGVGIERDPATACVKLLYHTGLVPGYGAAALYFPSTGSVYAHMGNGDGGTGDAPNAITAALAPVFGPAVAIPPTESCEPPPAAPVNAAVTPVVAEPTFTG
jgi:D-alanyl-D-alanine carboxypeptidase